jgi:hypothetical protein
MGLKVFSVQFRDEVLALNLRTPPDIVEGLTTLRGNSILQGYLQDIGFDPRMRVSRDQVALTNPGDVTSEGLLPRLRNLNKNLFTPVDYNEETVINDFNVIDPGNVETDAIIPRITNFARNKPLNVNDPSENDPTYINLSFGNYNYTSLLDDIGRPTVINDLSVPNSTSVTIQSNQPAEVSLELQLQQNRYVPVEINQFEPSVISLRAQGSTQPYIDAYNSGIFNYNNPQEYTPSSFLDLRTTKNPLSVITNTADPLQTFLTGNSTPPLENETLLMNIAALELKFNFESRIKRAVERETLGRTNLDEALTNPIASANIIRNPYGWINLFERDYEISIPSNPIGRGVEFAASLAGISNPVSSDFASSTRYDLSPSCFSTTESSERTGFAGFIDDLLGRSTSRQEDRDVYFLNRTGPGQKYSLFYSVGKNKYQPDYLADYNSGLFDAIEGAANFIRGVTGFLGPGGGDRPKGNYYIGEKKANDPVFILQDSDGVQVRSNQANTEVFTDNTFFEPGLSGVNGVSEYGSISTNFAWASTKKLGSTSSGRVSNFLLGEDFNTPNPTGEEFQREIKLFKECSILDVTNKIIEKGLRKGNTKYNSPIDQIMTKFYDGYDLMSRGNATIKPIKIERISRQGDVDGYIYATPGLDNITGKRDDQKMYEDVEFCRVWTKARPYSKINDLVRYKELIRKERNSVIDRNGNYNIFPSELNVNNGYGRPGENYTDATVEFFGSKRARKYMFSIENLAWRDHIPKTFNNGTSELPFCEKGPNGGRIMWFPPYEISFSENTAANWTAHQFLGRPESIYTYNNTDRSGTLSWKIVVDHPSVLNLITKKELASLTDNEVDELLAAFWSGCLEFDIFELARIWNQFSQSDIDYFKKVLADLDLTNPNEQVKKNIEQVVTWKQPQPTQTNVVTVTAPTSTIANFGLFFENDVPLDPVKYDKKFSPIYDSGKMESYDILFKNYYNLTKNINQSNNVEAIKAKYSTSATSASLVRYDYTLGVNSNTNYMESTSTSPAWFGMEVKYKAIEADLSDPKYLGFDLQITINAFASPIGPSSSLNTYNKRLALRRFASVTKWLVTKVMVGNNLGKIYYEDNTEVTDKNIDAFLTKSYQNNSFQITFYRSNDIVNGPKDKLTFTLVEAIGKTPEESIKEILATPPTAGPSNKIYFEVEAKDRNTNTKNNFCCFEDQKTVDDAIKGKWAPKNYTKDYIGSLRPNTYSKYADLVCGVLSIFSSYSRRVTLDVVAVPKTVTPPPVAPVPDNVLLIETDRPRGATNVTKREIAQRIINKLVTECDYFEYLRDTTPTIYTSLKEKFKYFHPAFHAITPEGLNSRLTFLQQCFRPGSTIKREGDTESCDASNTSFGKPPICVLRIGDFYHTKIVPENLSITYEPLIWDLNPEGIGAQPMVANISISFKYIGGSGLRKPVDQLQNALSFNFYANTDIYDDRTFANNDLFERSLINLERSFFDDNTLDLIPIVAAAERIVPNDFLDNIPYGTIGVITNRRRPTTAGGAYYKDLLTAMPFNESMVNQPYEVVSSNGKFYLRKADDENNLDKQNTLDGVAAPLSDTKYWQLISLRNYGEQAFRLEFNSATNVINPENEYLEESYFNWYDIQYYDIFKLIYQTYAEIVDEHIQYNKPLSGSNEILLDIFLNRGFGSRIDSIPKGKNILTVLNNFESIVSLDKELESFEVLFDSNNVVSNGQDIYLTIFNHMIKKGYTDFGLFNNSCDRVSDKLFKTKPSPIKLHMYPQNYLYKIGDGKTIVQSPLAQDWMFDDDTRFNPGYLTSGTENGVFKVSSTGALPIKDYGNNEKNVTQFLNSIFVEIDAKLQTESMHFMHYNKNNGPSVFDLYNQYFELPHKLIFINYLQTKIIDYFFGEIKVKKADKAFEITKKFAKLNTAIAGLSTVLEGYDIKKDLNNTFYFEVIPNEVKLIKSASEIFGYDPYDKYKKLSLTDENLIISLKDVRGYYYNLNNTLDKKKDVFLLGNGAYFFRQITRDSYIRGFAKEDFTNDNNLVESIAIRDNIELGDNDLNYEVPLNINDTELSGVILSNELKLDGTIETFTTYNIAPTSTEDLPGSYLDPYKMTYTFEKLNYEFFDFSNKAIEVMLKDKFIRPEYNVKIASPPNFLQSQFKALPNSDLVFYYGYKEAYKNSPINYYSIDVSRTGLSTNDPLYDVYEEINNFCNYEFKFTESFLKTVSVPNSESLLNQKILLKGFVDLFVLKVLSDLNDEDLDNIFNEISSAQDPKLDSNTGEKNKNEKVAKRKNKIRSVLRLIFSNIKSYTDEAAKVLFKLRDEYTNNYNMIESDIVKTLISQDNLNLPFTSAVLNSLLKGGENEYKLVIKDAVRIKKGVMNNYDIFKIGQQDLNFKVESNVPEKSEVDDPNRVTQFSKYVKN